MFIIKYKKIFLSFSFLLILLSLISLGVFGLKKGIDFTGGSRTQIIYKNEKPEIEILKKSIKESGLGESSITTTESGLYSVTLTEVSNDKRVMLKKALSLDGKFDYEEKTFNLVGPSIGKELTKKAFISIISVMIMIILFIAFSFRTVSKPVSSWKYGLLTIVTLAHDVIIPIGLFSFLGFYKGAEVDSLFVVALLTILGISISDTIVIFDRIRENLKLKISSDFEEVIGKSLDQSFARSINTSMTVIIVLFALYLFGPEPTKNFSLVLIAGMIVGTYSSIFVASPLLGIIGKMQNKNK
jgi:preprotein translocase subunit SecF